MGALRWVTERYVSIMGCCGALRSVAWHYGCVTELLRNRYRKYQFCPSL